MRSWDSEVEGFVIRFGVQLAFDLGLESKTH